MALTDLDDTPLADQPRLSPEAENFIDLITDLLDQGRYQFAADTLVGIRESVRESGRVTDGQRRAVGNIQTGGDRHAEQERNWGRRYEGWG